MNMLVRTLLVVVMVIALVYVVSRHHHDKTFAPGEGSGASTTPPPRPTATTVAAKPGPTHELRTVTAAQRAEIAAQIAAARAARAERKPTAPAQPATPTDPNQDYAAYADSFAVGMSDALKPLIGMLGKCIRDHGADAGSHHAAAVQITLDGDPDVGTLITTDSIADGTGQPISPALDDCVRGVLDAAELPPIKEGATLKTQFTFDLD